MDYIKLAGELEESKRMMIKMKNINAITDLENGENFVLGYLFRSSGSLNPKEISSALGVSSARMAAILNQLEAKGLVGRDADPNNGRQTIIRLLPNGIQQQKENERRYQERIVKFLEALGPEDAQDYVRIQKKIARLFGSKSGDI